VATTLGLAYNVCGVPNRLTEDTLVEAIIPTVIAVGCSQAFVERCRRVVARSGLIVEPEPLGGLATIVASRKPLALMIQRDIYDFDPDEFDLLARDVRGSLVVIEHEDMAFQALERQLSDAIYRAQKLRVD
jgi:hypothetical protein